MPKTTRENDISANGQMQRWISKLPCWITGHRWAWSINRMRGCDKCRLKQRASYDMMYGSTDWENSGRW